MFIKNRNEIYDTVSKLLIGLQSKAKDVVIQDTASSGNPSNADELKKFKNLLDSGAITQEEYNVKKKQILSL